MDSRHIRGSIYKAPETLREGVKLVQQELVREAGSFDIGLWYINHHAVNFNGYLSSFNF